MKLLAIIGFVFLLGGCVEATTLCQNFPVPLAPGGAGNTALKLQDGILRRDSGGSFQVEVLPSSTAAPSVNGDLGSYKIETSNTRNSWTTGDTFGATNNAAFLVNFTASTLKSQYIRFSPVTPPKANVNVRACLYIDSPGE